MHGGKPVLPNSAEEMLQQAHQFEQRTGKPYLIQSLVGDPAGAARNLYSYMMAQGAVLFPDPRHIRLNTPVGVRVATYFRQINVEHLGTLDMDTPAAIAAFESGEGGIYPTGTWMIGSFEQEAQTPGRPLYRNYAVFPYPRLWGERVEYVSGHSWVVPSRKRSAKQKDAIVRFFRFMAAHDYDWSRTGHIPAFRSVLDDPRAACIDGPPASWIRPSAKRNRGNCRRRGCRRLHGPEDNPAGAVTSRATRRHAPCASAMS
jgi:multiple sugar transport system substrate-binding protein